MIYIVNTLNHEKQVGLNNPKKLCHNHQENNTCKVHSAFKKKPVQIRFKAVLGNLYHTNKKSFIKNAMAC